MAYERIGDQEHLIFTVETEDGTSLDEDLVNRMLELPGEISDGIPVETTGFVAKRDERMEAKKQQIKNENKEYFLAECEKLDAYSEDLKEGLERDIKELGKLIKEKKKEFKTSSGDKTLEEISVVQYLVDSSLCSNGCWTLTDGRIPGSVKTDIYVTNRGG